MAWREIEADAPQFAARVRGLLQAHKHKTLATLRADGSPRISGIEAKISGHAVRVEEGFHVDLSEVALSYLDGLVIESWHPGRGHDKRVRD